MKQKRYNHEFKQTVVELYRSGQAVNDLAREYGVSEVTIYKWMKLASEVSVIQKENLKLKKAMTIFARK
ncbi:transposase [Rummeliibacillus suwonensis]|uniref:transposase n=1 Tax=Rummeliibacillus suwonensis TaxID=1306154 RepID=UPI0011B62887|nr:transposase [Rummeliibacillus suwonensis]